MLDRIAQLATRALNTPAIDDAPELRAIVVEVIGVVLQPIQGLFTRQDHDDAADAPESIIDTGTVLSTEVRS